MNKIENNRIGFDGNTEKLQDIETWYLSNVPTTDIATALNQIRTRDKSEQTSIKLLKSNIKNLIIAKPHALAIIARYVDIKYKTILECNKNKPNRFSKKILKAFNYSKYRNRVFMKDLAKKLNIKTCPYCNMHYTLYMERQKSLHKKTKLQYDHFWDKDSHPYLSMSFYNLIPSCSVCNQTKSNQKLPLDFNPYHADIHKYFKFHIDKKDITNPSNVDNTEVKLLSLNSTIDIDKYNNMFHIDMQYGRHKDIVKEIYEKVYLRAYYESPAFAECLPHGITIEPLQLLLGAYIDTKDIERRPLTKFIQDIWEQANQKLI